MNDLKKMLSLNAVSDPACKLVKAEQRNYFRFLRQVATPSERTAYSRRGTLDYSACVTIRDKTEFILD